VFQCEVHRVNFHVSAVPVLQPGPHRVVRPCPQRQSCVGVNFPRYRAVSVQVVVLRNENELTDHPRFVPGTAKIQHPIRFSFTEGREKFVDVHAVADNRVTGRRNGFQSPDFPVDSQGCQVVFVETRRENFPRQVCEFGHLRDQEPDLGTVAGNYLSNIFISSKIWLL